ncbi:hypothetical protein SRB17_25590 [Streptomyces sp. RB17]|uniref:hypothetical protein n=1 Tax=Streptomyces sp. RB17 TaxID=2585197 RepID=UPI001297CF53|nr:hypothetical protein [Streptomyces sp. RB17]MQY34589.1 hypothetical protein [Streptomyces sp. RB17]
MAASITEACRRRYAEATPTDRTVLGTALDASRANVYLADLATWVLSGQPAASGDRVEGTLS